MSIFDFEDYRKFILAELDSKSGGARGELTKISKLLGVNSSYLSQVLHGPKNFSPEQAFLIAQYFGLDELEARYLNEMINLERASTPQFRDFIKKQFERLKNEARWKAGLPPLDQPLDDRSQATFYSSWHYSAIQLATGISGRQTPATIAQRLNLDESIIRQALGFLVSCGLCITDGERYGIGTRRTHLQDNSPLRPRHHMNWRLKALDQMPKETDKGFFFTGPMRIDELTFEAIGKLLAEMTTKVNTLIDSAQDETLACLNIDWFRF